MGLRIDLKPLPPRAHDLLVHIPRGVIVHPRQYAVLGLTATLVHGVLSHPGHDAAGTQARGVGRFGAAHIRAIATTVGRGSDGCSRGAVRNAVRNARRPLLLRRRMMMMLLPLVRSAAIILGCEGIVTRAPLVKNPQTAPAAYRRIGK